MEISSLTLLDEIERKEMLSLSWGYVDGSMSRAAALALLSDAVTTEQAEVLLEELIRRRLVFELRGSRVRSRFAEAVRLLSRLRQLFAGRPWIGAPARMQPYRRG